MLPILHQSYWRDEAFSVLLSSKSLREILILTIKDVHPPLYYFLLHFWIKLFGDVEYVARSLSLLFHFLLVLSVFFLIKHLLKNWKVSLLGSFGVLLNPFLIEYAFETRAYMFFAFLITTATLFYLKRKWILASLFITLSLLTHNFAVFFLAAFIIHWSCGNKNKIKENLGQFALLFTLPILALVTWSIFLWNQWVKVAEGFWIEPKTSAIFVESFRAYFRGSKDYSSKGMLYSLTLVSLFLGVFYWLQQWLNKREGQTNNKKGQALIFLFSIPFLIVYVISAFWVPIFHERFLIPILPIFIVWIIYSLFKLAKVNQSLSHFIFALALAYTLFAVQSTEEIMKKTTKPAINHGVQQVLAKAGKNDVIMPESELNFLEVKYYVKRFRDDIPIYVYSPNKKVVFYIGSVLFEENEIIDHYPENRNVWIITPDGGHYLKTE